MRHIKLIIACAASMLALATSSCQKEQQPQEVQTGTVTGTVTDNLYNPIVDVAVSVKGTSISATTAADGSFTMEKVPMDKQTIIFSKEGFAQASASLTADRRTIAERMPAVSESEGWMSCLLFSGRINRISRR